jgi:hypothetical protein
MLKISEFYMCDGFVASEFFGSFTIRPLMNQPRDNLTHTVRPPNDPSAVTIRLCDIPTKWMDCLSTQKLNVAT